MKAKEYLFEAIKKNSLILKSVKGKVPPEQLLVDLLFYELSDSNEVLKIFLNIQLEDFLIFEDSHLKNQYLMTHMLMLVPFADSSFLMIKGPVPDMHLLDDLILEDHELMQMLNIKKTDDIKGLVKKEIKVFSFEEIKEQKDLLLIRELGVSTSFMYAFSEAGGLHELENASNFVATWLMEIAPDLIKESKLYEKLTALFNERFNDQI